MPTFLNTRGNSKIAIGICARCSEKVPYVDLYSDPNFPGLYVCADDLDQFDPWRLPARETEDITLDHPRPDVDISGQGATPVYTNQIDGIGQVQQPVTWSVNTAYSKGATVTPLSELDPTPLPQNWFLALTAGVSGAQAPNWPVAPGVEIVDGGVTWLNLGIYPN